MHEIMAVVPFGFWIVLSGTIGLVIGSFLNVVIYRVPKAESIVLPASHCPQCDTPIRPIDNIPVISYLMLRGRCHSCGYKISIKYPIVELLGCMVGVCAVLRYGVTIDALGAMVLGWHLIALAVVDIETMTVPDHIVLPMAVFGLLIAFLRGGVYESLTALISAGLAGAFFGLVWIVARISRGKEGLGSGDVMLSIGIALYLRPILLPLALISSATFGIIFALISAVIAKTSAKNREIPFAPSLALASWGVYMAGDVAVNAMIGWAMRLTA